VGRRAQGEGSVYQDKAGQWWAVLDNGWRGGKRDRRYRRAATKTEAVRKLRDLIAAQDAGTLPGKGRSPTVAGWLRHWLDEIAVRKVRPSTLRGYRTVVEKWLVPHVGSYRLDQLRPEHIERCYATLARQGLASGSVVKAHRVLSRALKVAEQRGMVPRNPAKLVDAPSLHREEVRPLERGEARRVLDVAGQRRNAARWSVALAIGLRQGEALGLRWDDVDLDQGVLQVRVALQRVTGQGLVLVEPKSAAARRSIALPASLVAQLREHRQSQRQERLRAGSEWADHGLVFPRQNGRPTDPRRDWAEWKALLAEAGVRHARLHDARHTAATLLLSQGVPARVAMGILGHSQITLTLGTYSHVVPELAASAAASMNEALWGASQDASQRSAAPRGPVRR
jgi:integrase